jgi:hypothetical protein
VYNNPIINKAEYYSFGYIYRRWARLNKAFPLLINGPHGIVKGKLKRENFNTDFIYFFVHNNRLKKEAKKLKFRSIKCAHPYLYYKELECIHVTNSQTGGIYFLSHSISGATPDYNITNILTELGKIKNKIKKITVCIYYLDWDNWHKIFEDAGYSAVCLGVPMDVNFVKNLYDLLNQHAVILDDSLGSHIFYGIDFGLKIWRFRTSDEYKTNFLDDLHDENFLNKLERIFPVTAEPTISSEQIMFVNEEMGSNFLGHRRFLFKLIILWATAITYFRLLKKPFYSN